MRDAKRKVGCCTGTRCRTILSPQICNVQLRAILRHARVDGCVSCKDGRICNVQETVPLQDRHEERFQKLQQMQSDVSMPQLLGLLLTSGKRTKSKFSFMVDEMRGEMAISEKEGAPTQDSREERSQKLQRMLRDVLLPQLLGSHFTSVKCSENKFSFMDDEMENTGDEIAAPR